MSVGRPSKRWWTGSLGVAGVAFALGAHAAAGHPPQTELPKRRADEASAEYLARAFAALPLSEARAVFRLAPLGGRGEASSATKDEIGRRLLTTLGESSRGGVETSDLDAAMSDARRGRLPLVFVEARVENHALLLEISEYGFARQFWQRAVEPRGRRLWTHRLSVALDASLGPKRPSRIPRAERLGSHSLSDILNATCAASEDGRSLVVGMLGRRRIQTMELTQSGVVLRADRVVDELSPLSPAPLRQPLGSIAADEGGWLVGSSDRADLLRLDRSLAPLARYRRGYPVDGERCLAFREDGLDGRAYVCTEKEPEPAKSMEETRLRSEFRGSAGERSFVVRQSARSQRIFADILGAERVELSPGGAEAALVGFGPEHSGAPTVVVARPRAPGLRAETVLLARDATRGGFGPLVTLPIAEPKAAAPCPPHVEAGSLSLVWTENEIWVVR